MITNPGQADRDKPTSMMQGDTAQWADRLGISQEAVSLYQGSNVIDLHIDSYIWHRLFGYDMRKKRRQGPFGRAFMGQADIPRACQALTGATWVITTNPFRFAAARERAFHRDLERLERIVADDDGLQLVNTVADYERAKAAGKHAAWIGIQGGNALDRTPTSVESLAGSSILRVTLVHLTQASLGATSSPAAKWYRTKGLTAAGHAYVERLNAMKIFVDLAHISRPGFFDAVQTHDSSQPLLVTHTGVAGVHEHWRNVTDEQLRVVADTGGTVGVMLQASFLAPRDASVGTVVDHLQHICDTVGDDHASIGTDFDGAIVPPADLTSVLELPRLVQEMLNRRWSDERIRKILGGNFLRSLKLLRG